MALSDELGMKLVIGRAGMRHADQVHGGSVGLHHPLDLGEFLGQVLPDRLAGEQHIRRGGRKGETTLVIAVSPGSKSDPSS